MDSTDGSASEFVQWFRELVGTVFAFVSIYAYSFRRWGSRGRREKGSSLWLKTTVVVVMVVVVVVTTTSPTPHKKSIVYKQQAICESFRFFGYSMVRLAYISFDYVTCVSPPEV